MSLVAIDVVEREGGASTFQRPDPGRLVTWLERSSVGGLWQKNMLGGALIRDGADAVLSPVVQRGVKVNW